MRQQVEQDLEVVLPARDYLLGLVLRVETLLPVDHNLAVVNLLDEPLVPLIRIKHNLADLDPELGQFKSKCLRNHLTKVADGLEVLHLDALLHLVRHVRHLKCERV